MIEKRKCVLCGKKFKTYSELDALLSPDEKVMGQLCLKCMEELLNADKHICNRCGQVMEENDPRYMTKNPITHKIEIVCKDCANPLAVLKQIIQKAAEALEQEADE